MGAGVMKQAEKETYASWYRVAEKALGDLIPHFRKTDEITKWVSRENWLLIPNYTERNRREAASRPDPNIYFALNDGELDLGIVCNTLASVKKLRNIMGNYHAPLREEFLDRMKRLPDIFIATVSAKKKLHHFRESPEYEERSRIHSNMIDKESIKEIFALTDSIAEEGRLEMQAKNLRYPTITPMIYIARTKVPKTNQEFLREMASGRRT